MLTLKCNNVALIPANFAEKSKTISIHSHIEIFSESGERVKALAPVIVSASRSTDIPAFFATWFFDRLNKGYCLWKNPYNGKDSYVSFANTRFIVFWSKNPKPLLPHLSRLRERGIGFYIQYTLNDYEQERLEPNVPMLTERIDTFKRIVDTSGFWECSLEIRSLDSY